MPKAKSQKWYAVLIGRDGPQIYTDWDTCKEKVSRYPGAVYKSFKSKKEAEDWLGDHENQPLVKAYFEPHGSTYASKEKSPRRKDSDSGPSSSTSTPEQRGITLSPEQRQVLDRVKAGQNVFFTGSAGTGKSILLREIIGYAGGLDSSHVAITASTGIAAVNIGGTTLHSWAGIGLGNEPATRYIGKFFGQRSLRSVLERWKSVKTLIIDEISMLDGTLFDTLEEIARGIRQNDRPFGGIQLVLCGDFCQLPPVTGRDPSTGKEKPTIFTFEAKSWNACIPTMMSLTRVFRQKDQAFVDMLNEMRFGTMRPSTVEAFRGLSRKLVYNDGIEPTELYSTRREVDFANRTRLEQLPGEVRTYSAQDLQGIASDGKVTPFQKMEQLLDRLLCPKVIKLKIGAQVMLVKNLQQGRLVNGSVGTIVKFMSVADATRERKGIAQQDRAGEAFATGSSNSPIDVDAMGMEDVVNPSLAVPESAPNAPPQMLWPLIRFIGGDERLMIPADFTVNNADGGVEARRIQLPLILAWALSVHKSQGQTLERVKVDLKRTFEKGQAYVALSRATTMSQLQVLNFDPAKVLAHPRVLAWYGVKAGIPKNQQEDGYDYDDIDLAEMDCEEAMQAYYDQ